MTDLLPILNIALQQLSSDGLVIILLQADRPETKQTRSTVRGKVDGPPQSGRLTTMNETDILNKEMNSVIKNLESREWVQGDYIDGDKVCAHGAVRTCETLRPGDKQIITAMMRAKGLTEKWNDENGRTKGEVLARMRRIKVSDNDLAETFGPNWEPVIAVIRRAAILTKDEAQRLTAVQDCEWKTAYHAVLGAASDEAKDALLDAASEAAWDAAWNAVLETRNAAVDEASGVDRYTAWSAAETMAAVVVAAMLRGRSCRNGDIDTLTKPWVDVLGMEW